MACRWLLALGSLLVSCGDPQRPPRYRSVPPDASLDAGLQLEFPTDASAPPAPDAAGYCGNQLIRTRSDVTNLYFVVDRSGSMAEPLAGSPWSKYVNARLAIRELLRAVGHRVSYGATVFPSRAGACSAGEEILPTAPGDPYTSDLTAPDGPRLMQLLVGLTVVGIEGGTPTAPTLAALVEPLRALQGRSYVILTTDGQPNCNAAARCGAKDCSINQMAQGLSQGVPVVNGVACLPTVNCCDPTLDPLGPLECVDGTETVRAVTALAAAGINTYVVGMPGSEYFADVLDSIGKAGGTGAENAPHYYYAVSGAEQLASTLLRIGTRVSISCSVTLEEPPPEPKLVNVYLDVTELPNEEMNGWVWTGESSIEIRGSACASVMSGDIRQIQVVAGCPTRIE